jgi:hypothetical protein
MCKARHIRNYLAQEVGYNVEFQFDYNIDEVRATFSCSDDYADPALCHNADDLLEYIVRRYGAFLIKENLSTPKNFAMDMKKIGEAITNPLLKRRDNYQDEYTKIVGNEEWKQLRELGFKYEKELNTSSYTKPAYEYRIGIWHG